MSNMQQLLNTLPQIGKIEKIAIRPAKKADLLSLEQVNISIENGLEGDHYRGSSRKRQITLIQAEHLEVVAKLLGKPQIEHNQIRRNIIVSGINLLALKDKTFQIGKNVTLEMTGLCHPCSRMEENLGTGGYNAMRGHGGITAKVLTGGTIHIGDEVKLIVLGQTP